MDVRLREYVWIEYLPKSLNLQTQCHVQKGRKNAKPDAYISLIYCLETQALNTTMGEIGVKHSVQ